MKRAQAAVFIIIAILIICIFFLLFQFRQSLVDKARETEIFGSLAVPPEFRAIKADIQDCIDRESKEALFLLGLQGGYLDLDSIPKTQWLDFNVSYLYFQNRTYVPSIQTMEEELTSYLVDSIFEKCKKQYPGFNVSYALVGMVGTDIEGKKVNFRIFWQVEIEKGRIREKFKDFSTDFDVRLAELQKFAQEITETYAEAPDNLCMSCLIDKAKEKDLLIELIARENELIFIITDPHSKIDEEYFRLIFAYRL